MPETMECTRDHGVASEEEMADITLKSGRRVGNVVARRVKRCFC